MQAVARNTTRTGAALLIAVAIVATISGSTPAAAGNLGQLNSQLGATQAREQSLSASIAALDSQLASLTRQIRFVQGREAAVRTQLAADQAHLATVHGQVIRERALVKVLKARLGRALTILRAQLVSRYENQPPTLVTVVLNAGGFAQLLEQLNFLGRAEHQQQAIITITRLAKQRADAATVRLIALQTRVTQITNATAAESRALQGMNSLLASRQAAASHLRAARQVALSAARARGARLQASISKIKAQQAAAAAAAAAAAQAGAGSSGPALGASGGWAIPYPIVLCESGGQNLPPNSAGASGYYQIIPSTWRGEGGSGPAAYLAPKSEQDAIAAKLWNGGAGWDNWVCAQILGIH